MERNITKEEINSLLTQDAYYRKIGTWPLLTSKDIINNVVQKITTEYFLVSKTCEDYMIFPFSSFEEFTTNINKKHPFTTELLVKFQGNIVVCGGSVTKSLITKNYHAYHSNTEDVDIFFYNLGVEEATKLRMEIIEFLVYKWLGVGAGAGSEEGKLKITILRNEFVTTIYFTRETDEYNFRVRSYQLIHRIYPNISSIIGGFDINVCMVAYDGNEIYATPLGAWALKNHTIIIDTKRRSTSFEYRLCKYYDYGFNILFPGLTQEIINDLIIKPCRSLCKEGELLDEIYKLASKYDYTVHSLIISKNNETDDVLFIDQQKKEDILPFLNINDGNNMWRRDDCDGEVDYDSYDKIKIGILPYNLKDIENRHTTKISDYSHNSIDLKFMSDINATRLRLDNLSSVVSVLKIKDVINSEILLDEANNPNLMFTSREIESYIGRAEEAKNFYASDFHTDACEDKYFIYKDTLRLTRCFGRFALEVSKIRNTEEYQNYILMMIEKMTTNARICKENLTGIKWITKNPGRQWTSSINPIISDPREWYGKHYVPVLTGIPEEIETILRLLCLPKTKSVWTMLPDDIFNLLLQYIMKSYANDAWQYI